MGVLGENDKGPVVDAVGVNGEGLSLDLSPVEKARRRLASSVNANSVLRNSSRELWRAYKGDPFSREDVEYMEIQTDRPLVRLNLFAGTINAVAGADMSEVREPIFNGVDKSIHDTTIADWFTRVVRRFHNKAEGHTKEHGMLLDKLLTGYGCNSVDLDDKSFPFFPKQSHPDMRDIYLDPRAKESGVIDLEWFFHEQEWTLSDVKDTFPDTWQRAMGDMGSEIGIETWWGSGRGLVTVVDNDYGPGSSAGIGTVGPFGGDIVEPTVRVLLHQYKIREKWVAFTDPKTGEDVQMPYKEAMGDSRGSGPESIGRITLLQAMTDESGGLLYPKIPYITFRKQVVRQAYYAAPRKGGDHLVELEDLALPYSDMTYIFDTGFVERDVDTGKVTFFGLGHVCLDPQRYIARMLSLIVEKMRRSSGGGVFIKPGILESPGTFLSDWTRPNAPIMIKDEADIDKSIKTRDGATWSHAEERLLGIVMESLPEVSGVTKAYKGTTLQERSSVALQNMQAQTASMLLPIMAPTMAARKRIGRLYAEMVQKWVPDKVINKIIGDDVVPGLTHQVGPNGEVMKYPDQDMDPMTGQPTPHPMAGQPIPIMVPDERARGQVDPQTGQPAMVPVTPAYLLRRASVTEFDIEVDLGVASTTARQAVWRIFTDTAMLPKLLEIFPGMGGILPDLIKYLPLPPEMSARLSAKMEAAMEAGPDQIIQMASQLPPDQIEALMEGLAQLLGGGQQMGQPGAQGQPMQSGQMPGQMMDQPGNGAIQ